MPTSFPNDESSKQKQTGPSPQTLKAITTATPSTSVPGSTEFQPLSVLNAQIHQLNQTSSRGQPSNPIILYPLPIDTATSTATATTTPGSTSTGTTKHEKITIKNYLSLSANSKLVPTAANGGGLILTDSQSSGIIQISSKLTDPKSANILATSSNVQQLAPADLPQAGGAQSQPVPVNIGKFIIDPGACQIRLVNTIDEQNINIGNFI